MCERLEEPREDISSRDTILYIYILLVENKKREISVLQRETWERTWAEEDLLPRPLKTAKKRYRQDDEGEEKKVFLHPGCQGSPRTFFFQSECQEQDQQV